MVLSFDIKKRGGLFLVNIYYVHHSPDLFGELYETREYLTEDQYQSITNWCNKTFQTTKPENHNRVRRMSYADYLFKSKKDLDWLILSWSGVDIESF